jgi:hypothetical protein
VLWLAPLLAILWLGTVGRPGAGFREMEVACEEAAQHLGDCCPQFNRHSLHCTWDDEACESTRPDLSVSQARCIRNMSCTSLQRERYCELNQATLDAGIEEELACLKQ